LVSHIRGEHRLEEFENRVLRNIFGPKREKVLRAGETCILRSWTICTAQYIFLG